MLTADGQEIGFSAGRVVSTTYRRMISLGFINREYAALGTRVAMVWGNPACCRSRSGRRSPGSRLLEERNDKVDVEKIPHFKG